MIPSTRSTLILTALLLCVFAAPAWGDETAVPKGETPAKVEEPAAASPLDRARTRWEASPTNINRAIKFQDALLEAGKPKEAARIFRALHREKKADATLAFLYGRSRGDDEGRALMRASMQRGLAGATSKDLLGAWIALAVADVQASDGKHAASAATRVAELRGLAADWLYLGWIQEQLVGDAAKAKKAYQQALKKEPDHLAARGALVILLAGNGEAAAAVTLAEGTVAKHADSSAAYLHLGLAHGMAGHSAEAAKALAKALSCAGRDADALVDVAAAYTDIEDQALAQKALTRALEVDPKHGRALAAAGILAMDQGRLKEAKDLLGRAAKVRSKDARVAFLEGLCAERMGRDSAAAAAYGRAMRYAPDRVDYVTALAMARMRAESYRSAVSVLKRAIKMAPDDASLRLQMGIGQMHLKKHKLARAAFEEAARLAPKDPRPHYYLAVIHGDKLGKSELALKALERYEQLGGKDPSAIAWLEELRREFPGR